MNAVDCSVPMYEIHGLRIRSEVELVGASLSTRSEPDLEVFYGESRPIPALPASGSVLAFVEFTNGVGYSVTQGAERFTIRFFNICDFEITLDRRIVRVYPANGQDPRMISLLLAGNVLATLLTIAGELVLHASAVDVGGRAVAFVGDSGAGKSTLAALFCSAGYRLIADDVLRIDLAALHCYPGSPQIRLRAGAATLADRFTSERIGKAVDDRIVIGMDQQDQKTLPLAAIIVPRPSRKIDRLQIDELSHTDAHFTLLRHPRILGWKSLEVIRMQFKAIAELVDRVPLFVAQIPWGPPFDAELTTELLKGARVEPLADVFL